MIEDFELESRHQKILNKIKNKWRKVGIKYKERVEELKKQNEKTYILKSKLLEKKLKEKEEVLQKNIDTKKRLKSEERERLGNLMKQKTENVAQNLVVYLKKQEEERLKLEKSMFQKSKFHI